MYSYIRFNSSFFPHEINWMLCYSVESLALFYLLPLVARLESHVRIIYDMHVRLFFVKKEKKEKS